MESTLIILLIGIIIGLVIFRPSYSSAPYPVRDNTGIIFTLVLLLGVLVYQTYTKLDIFPVQSGNKEEPAKLDHITNSDFNPENEASLFSLSPVDSSEDLQQEQHMEPEPFLEMDTIQKVIPNQWLSEKDLGFAIQVGAFENWENANRLSRNINDKLQLEGFIIKKEQDTKTLYKVWIGKFETIEEAIEYRNLLLEYKFDALDPHLILLEPDESNA